MDPNAAYSQILEAAAISDHKTVYDTSSELAQWVSRGGVMPDAFNATLATKTQVEAVLDYLTIGAKRAMRLQSQ